MAAVPLSTPVQDSVSKIAEEVAVGEDLKFQRSWWRFERTVWIFFVALIVLDVAGAFGRGPMAHARIHSADGSLDVHYERVERSGTPSIMTVILGPAAVRDGVARLFVSNSLIDSLGAQRIIPEPASTVLGAAGLTYSFPATASPVVVRFELQPTGAGRFAFSVGLPDAAPLGAKVLVVP
jgi:hypothetical protein